MRVYYGSEDLKLEKSAVALGDFDAIHKGHTEIINSAGEYAKENGLLHTVYMFSHRPNKKVQSVNSTEKRLEILEGMGVEVVVVDEFTEEYKNTACEEFVSEYIVKRLGAEAVFIGYNYRFGKGASGNGEMLKALCKPYGVEVFIKDCVRLGESDVSSSEIRRLINCGMVDKAGELMGRYFSVSGQVVKGKQLGRTIGFPTANMEYPKDTVVPQNGVYISRSIVGKNKYYSITNVGGKPTVDDENKNIETAIGEFSGDIYGEKIEVEFVRKIRDIIKFDTLPKLQKQLEKDLEKSRMSFEEEKI